MKNKIEVSQVKWRLQTFDLEGCKDVANWLYRHIKILETDFTEIDRSIEDMGFSNRALNVLKINDIDSISKLTITASDWVNFVSLKGVGSVVAEEIRRKVYEFQNTYIFKEDTVTDSGY